MASLSLESWKATFEIGGIVLLFLTFVSGAGALYTTNRINKIQSARLRQFDKDLTDAKTILSAQQTDLAKQKERTAIAEKAALDAALALEKFKQPRYLSLDQQKQIVAAMKPFAGQHFAFAVFPDPEPLALLRLLNELLTSAGWKRVPSQIQRPGGILLDAAGESAAEISDSGIDIYLAPSDNDSLPAQSAVCVALVAAGIPCERHRTPQLEDKKPMAITISVGKKP